ncbi:conserved hypothetical protein [Vibrio phage KVP40]|uniref:NrdC.11 n=2 Tax=Schizotequatrovirus KVP40 TaxID=1914019 RepID=Q6WI01_BPKVM|nr:nucleotidyltransferase [Vibrio phage KVP40]QIW90886.1 hypothetical protein COHAPHLL_00023 [Vibrio phage V09]UNA02058.1 hypothetical protein [Vibrio phage PC-Liy1]URQ03357.1 hypothetical protein PVA8_371 [Vibrio phage PVA8]WBM59090.1 hypothetical protein vBValMPVA8_368 [Vibrio phage vB_ValM_PVA8]AAQ64222.1 conserved hypothetical protein [Vibrio phage KVP40]
MNVLFTSLFGSKLYGTDTPESDTDYKAVYLPELRTLLRGVAIKNSVHSTGKSFEKNGADDEDFEYIPVQVFMRDFLGGQSYAIELAFNALQNPDDCKPEFYNMCKEMTRKYLTSNVKAMTGYALNQAQKYGIKGTRLNSLMQFARAVETHNVDPKAKLGSSPELCKQLWELCAEDAHVRFQWYHGPKTKDASDLKDPAFSVLEKVFGLEITFEEAAGRLEKMMSKYGARAYQARAASGSDWKAISHAMRVIDQAIDILTVGKLEFPLKHAAFYRDVKQGKYKWEYVSEVLQERLELLEKAKDTTSLPHHTPDLVARFYTWYDDYLDEFYFPCEMTDEEVKQMLGAY